ncbi:hypothetical protein GSI_08384 [Ganoderma sinense ZZ0214-1]|uniref:Uncharacterized protein n=1 Tax=Ganoderma sinense ZZ0214-1 TaxID=1077348 RepID=A0A2G8S6N6_9APHY|nr:hypothetical protein GSI_08384 [Ganoderma sinense ZZ0214-1]
MSTPTSDNADQCVRNFHACLEDDDNPGATEIRDFMLKMSYAFPSMDVLLPAPLAVSILGQLTILATSTDFKLVVPLGGFQHVGYPNSFRATIIQLVDTGVLALKDSYSNFDQMNKECGTVLLRVNDIIRLLVGHEDNTPEQNHVAIQRHLPHYVELLGRTIEFCGKKAKDTHDAFDKLLKLTMEIHESCVATQGLNEGEIQKAKLQKANLEQKERATREMERIGEETLQSAREEFDTAQSMFANAIHTMPDGVQLAAIGSCMDTLANMLVMGFQCYLIRKTPQAPPHSSDQTTTQSDIPIKSIVSDISDRGYKQASILRDCSEGLSALLTPGSDGRLNWDAIKSENSGGCLDISVKCEEVINSLTDSNPNAGDATKTAIELAKRGKDLATVARDMIPNCGQGTVDEVTNKLSAWHDDVVKFASTADLKLNASLLSPPFFLPSPTPPHNQFGNFNGKAKMAMQAAQYKVSITQAQLNASRESSKVATNNLMEVKKELGHIMAELASINIQNQNWEEITSILVKAIGFLSDLKAYLNSLVRFFNSVDNFVSHLFKHAANDFISVIKHSSGIEDQSNGVMVMQTGSITLDAFSRENIYKYALCTAKLNKVVEHTSGMYVTLYKEHIDSGVNMLMRMGKLVGAQNPGAVVSASKEIQGWAEEAYKQIAKLISQKRQADEKQIEDREKQLMKSFSAILPRSSNIDRIASAAGKNKVEEVTSATSAAAAANPVYGSGAKRTRNFTIPPTPSTR